MFDYQSAIQAAYVAGNKAVLKLSDLGDDKDVFGLYKDDVYRLQCMVAEIACKRINGKPVSDESINAANTFLFEKVFRLAALKSYPSDIEFLTMFTMRLAAKDKKLNDVTKVVKAVGDATFRKTVETLAGFRMAGYKYDFSDYKNPKIVEAMSKRDAKRAAKTEAQAAKDALQVNAPSMPSATTPDADADADAINKKVAADEAKAAKAKAKAEAKAAKEAAKASDAKTDELPKLDDMPKTDAA